MQISLSKIKQHLKKGASAFVSDAEAEYWSEAYINTHLKKAPRMNPLQDAVSDLLVWQANKGRKIQTLVEKPGGLIMDFNGLAPSLKIKSMHDELETRAKRNGIAALGFKNAADVITLGMWSDGLAQRDLIGISMYNGGTESCVPYGGKKGVLGTNPFSYAVPTAGQPMSADMATTQVPFFDITQAIEENKPLIDNAAVDQDGQPTTDANKVLSESGIVNLLPMGGGFKGYSFMMLIEVLTGSLIQSLLSTEQTSGWHTTEYGCLTLAIDIGSFTDLSVFKTQVSAMCDTLRKEEPAKGFDAVSVPGDRGEMRIQNGIKKGSLDMDDDDYSKLIQFIESL